MRLELPVRHGAALAVGLACAMATAPAPAATPPASFAMVGHIERFTLDDAGDAASSARVTVRGIAVTLPRNLVITMPGGYLTAAQLFRGRDFAAPVDPARSGLALADLRPADLACPAGGTGSCPLPPAEIEVQGNIVDVGAAGAPDLRYVAGVARISQGALHIGDGFIQAIDSASGVMTIGADRTGGATVRVRLNDPEGIYGPRSTGSDMRFALDPGNAPVHASTGFPVCLPNAAAPGLCPAANRPAPGAANERRFTCGAVAASNDAPVHAGCRPALPVPLRAGDFVHYVGMLDKDGSGYHVSAHGLDAELGIYTSPGVDPAYVFIEEALSGTKGARYPDIPQEETTRFKLVAFMTDPSRSARVELFDDGAAADPLLPVPAGSRLATRVDPTNGAQLGRLRMVWAAKEDARIVRRNVRVVLSPATQPSDARFAPGRSSTGLAAGSSRRAGYAFGQYEAPISEYIAPEITRFGVRGYPVAANFEDFCFLHRTNAVPTQEPDRSDATQYVVFAAKPLSPMPVAPDRRSQPTATGQRLCGD